MPGTWREVWRSFEGDIVAEISGYVVRISQPDADGNTDNDRESTFWTVDDIAEMARAVATAAP